MAIVVTDNPPIEKAIEAIRGLEPDASNVRRIRQLWRRKLALVMKQQAIPAMREITPKRTGNAARSLRVKTISQPFGLEVGTGRKGFYLQFHPDAAQLQERYDNIVRDVYNRHGERLLNEAIRETYGL